MPDRTWAGPGRIQLTDSRCNGAPAFWRAAPDCVVEARGAEGLFGEERLASLLRSSAALDAAGIVERIERAVDEFQAGQPHDDIAIPVVRIPR